MRPELASLAPANGQNAILNAAFSIEFDAIPDAPLVAGFAALFSQLSSDGFDPPLPVNTFTMAFGGPTGMPTQEINGFRYLRKNTAGQVVREFSLQGNAIVVVVHDYSRWRQVWIEVEGLLQKCAPLLAVTQRCIRAVAMQFTDKFTWRDVNTPLPSKLVLRNSKWLVPGALDETGPWHSMFGHVKGVGKSGWAQSRIDNVNLSVADENSFKSLTIFTIQRYFAAILSKTPENFVSKILPELFNLAHDDNKELMRELLTVDVCQLIQLDAP